ncbi:MAG: ribosome assembly RNA-binding protein YhbY [Deltaproteobacteria bacterium]|uniref:CRM domain-containing protein n=2 Tax=Desulforhabdus amnigena TaxID=40218 RepID=A0A9W6FSU3_9BACT|nr:ribosome assembly RNA-binding protein YhbY [Deltaproteobacteria bacterium]NLJ29953.1 ribosome assembly RNA-binding protein YhbY [Deltaproteobacteria bacterium]GLI34443.1 hypothetical protein DAMNIGENAA_18760 [Desulforhabdus amnigena]
MENLSSFQRQYLKGLAHHLKPVVQIGKNGLTDQLFDAVDIALNAHELIKIKFLDFQEQKKELSQEIAERLNCERVALVGNIAILYRQHPDLAKRKISLPA